jgi:hypothetical protein
MGKKKDSWSGGDDWYSGRDWSYEKFETQVLPKQLVAYIPQHLLEKMNWFITRADGEIGGMGRFIYTATMSEAMIVQIDRIDLLEGDTSAGHVKPHPKPLDNWFTEAFGKDWRGSNPCMVFWHSHPFGDVSPSYVDDGTIDGLCKTKGMVLSLIGNKEGKYSARLYWKHELDGEMVTLEVRGVMKIRYPCTISRKVEEEYEKEFETKIEPHVTSYIPKALTKYTGATKWWPDRRHREARVVNVVDSYKSSVPRDRLIEIPHHGEVKNWTDQGVLCGNCGIVWIHDKTKTSSGICTTCAEDLT